MTQQIGDASSPRIDLNFAYVIHFRTHYILKELRDVGLAGQKVDFLYDFMRIYFSSAKLTLT